LEGLDHRSSVGAAHELSDARGFDRQEASGQGADVDVGWRACQTLGRERGQYTDAAAAVPADIGAATAAVGICERETLKEDLGTVETYVKKGAHGDTKVSACEQVAACLRAASQVNAESHLWTSAQRVNRQKDGTTVFGDTCHAGLAARAEQRVRTRGLHRPVVVAEIDRQGDSHVDTFLDDQRCDIHELRFGEDRDDSHYTTASHKHAPNTPGSAAIVGKDGRETTARLARRRHGLAAVVDKLLHDGTHPGKGTGLCILGHAQMNLGENLGDGHALLSPCATLVSYSGRRHAAPASSSTPALKADGNLTVDIAGGARDPARRRGDAFQREGAAQRKGETHAGKRRRAALGHDTQRGRLADALLALGNENGHVRVERYGRRRPHDNRCWWRQSAPGARFLSVRQDAVPNAQGGGRLTRLQRGLGCVEHQVAEARLQLGHTSAGRKWRDARASTVVHETALHPGRPRQCAALVVNNGKDDVGNAGAGRQRVL
jgi:hypothetical protein